MARNKCDLAKLAEIMKSSESDGMDVDPPCSPGGSRRLGPDDNSKSHEHRPRIPPARIVTEAERSGAGECWDGSNTDLIERLAAVEKERDEWKMRAEDALTELSEGALGDLMNNIELESLREEVARLRRGTDSQSQER